MLGAVTQEEQRGERVRGLKSWGSIAEFTTPDGTRHCAAVDEGFIKVEDNDVAFCSSASPRIRRSPKPTARLPRGAAPQGKKSFCAAAYASIKEAQATVAKTVNTLRGVDKVERIQ